ncbi:DUF262 domain-containing protein [Konateibacter massiliensis]|uniref:DUF262 domain-containing protein n=1 Tax=Konateibacter massiliensis TaxID=2002841 RepID=UPI000C15126A|nr:DUF262 domain-containing protein [Konateibacter massiliensis]
MAKKIRKQTLALKSYLEKMKEENQEIRSDQDVQRLSGQWDNSMINELVATVLTDDYIPPIILGEEEREDDTTQLWVIDGLQRSSTLDLYRYGNWTITSAIEDSIIEYQKNKIEDGKVCRDEEGNLIKDTVEFDIKGKTFDELPNELKKKFDDYQIEMAVHQNCTMEQISKLIRRYNNHRGMNTVQKAFTYLNNFARKIRAIIDMRFFKDCMKDLGKEKIKGGYERIIMESVMVMFHLDKWKKTPKDIGKYLNNNATDEEFDVLKEVISRLEPVVDDNFKEIFNMKDSFIWFAFFHRFLKLGLDDSRFRDFLKEFTSELHNKTFEEYDNRSFDTVDGGKGTKDKRVIIQKLDMLEKLMNDFLHIKNVEFSKNELEIENNEVSKEQFIAENVGMDIEDIKADMELYEQSLDDLLDKAVKDGSKLLNKANRVSLLAMISYSYKEDKDLDEWMLEYAKNNNTYFIDQKKNYIHMLKDLENFIKKGVAA